MTTTAPTSIRPRRLVALIAGIVAAATAANLALFVAGRAVGASLTLDPGVGDPNHTLIAIDVAWKTLVPLVLGAAVAAVLVTRARRARATVGTALAVVAGAVGVASGVLPVLGSHDAPTAWLVGGMHAVATIGAVAIALAIRRWAPRA